MTPSELEKFLKAQAKMSARIAKKAARARTIAQAYSAQGGSRSGNFARKVIQSLVRPGVAPGQRPKSKTGGETFHFDVTTINRTSDFTRAQTGARKGAGAAHGSYIERDGAAERLGDQFARTKAEMLDDTWAALGGQAYIERPDAAEEVEGYRLASFGNIAKHYDDRIAFWEAMEKAASRPRTHGIITQRGDDPAFWAKVDSDPEAPMILKNAPPFIPLPDQDPGSDRNAPRVIPAPRLSDEPSLDVLEYYRKHRSPAKQIRKNASKPVPVDFDPGRGGRIQTRLIVELPHELTPPQRLKLARDYCHKKFVEGRDQPLPHWCVIHAPDHHNDPRNVHMHIVFAERPCRRMIHPETGQKCWDFEIQIKVRDENKHNRLCRPFEQPTDRSINSAHWIKQARQDFAILANQALAAAGKPKIYDPRTYAAMGIDEKARERINGKDYVREKRGESTAAGDKAITAQWEREELRLARRFETLGPHRQYLDTFDVEIARWRGSESSVSAHLMVQKHEYSMAVSLIKVMKAERAANGFVLAKIQSKVMPPLQAKDEDALEAQDFIRMFRQDIVLRHDPAIRAHRDAGRRALTALARAQKANPRTTTDAGFLTGRSPIPEIVAPPSVQRAMRRNASTEQVFAEWQEALIEDIAERHVMRKAALEQRAARRGDLVHSEDPERNAAEEAKAKKRAEAFLPEEIPQSARTLKTSTAVLMEAARIIEESRAAAAAAGQPAKDPLRPPPSDGTPTLEAAAQAALYPDQPYSKDDAAATTVRDIAYVLNANVPKVVVEARAELPADKRKYGDEIAIAFMSEEGDPIQRRVYSPTRIRTADEQAAAVAAAIARRRAERIAKNDAEIAAMRAPPTTPQPTKPKPTTTEERAAPQTAPAGRRTAPSDRASATDASAQKHPSIDQPSRQAGHRPIEARSPAGAISPSAAPTQAANGRPSAGATIPPQKPPAQNPGAANPEPLARPITPNPIPPRPATPTDAKTPVQPPDKREPDPYASLPFEHPQLVGTRRRTAAIPTPGTPPSGTSPETANTDRKPTPSENRAEPPRPATPNNHQGPTPPAGNAPSRPEQKSKKRVITAEELRRRALLAAKGRGRGR